MAKVIPFPDFGSSVCFCDAAVAECADYDEVDFSDEEYEEECETDFGAERDCGKIMDNISALVLLQPLNESVNRYPDRLDLLSKCLRAAEGYGEPFTSKARGDAVAYYPEAVRYVGACYGQHGRVNIAFFSYVRSGPRNSIIAHRTHHFLAFLDDAFRIRFYWRLGNMEDAFTVFENRLFHRGEKIFDFDAVPGEALARLDGMIYPAPVW
ncbi:MAG: hypothetical protein JXR97_06895 [Planctomycetes bacterium]|nr:hypothetical protein [Planctomycetota bacterium]